MICWAKIDERFFGEGGLEDRLQLLTLEERMETDDFVKRKMTQHTLKDSGVTKSAA